MCFICLCFSTFVSFSETKNKIIEENDRVKDIQMENSGNSWYLPQHNYCWFS